MVFEESVSRQLCNNEHWAEAARERQSVRDPGQTCWRDSPAWRNRTMRLRQSGERARRLFPLPTTPRHLATSRRAAVLLRMCGVLLNTEQKAVKWGLPFIVIIEPPNSREESGYNLDYLQDLIAASLLSNPDDTAQFLDDRAISSTLGIMFARV